MPHNSWRPTTSAQALKARALLYSDIRNFFAQRQVLEVDTPFLAHYGVSDIHIQCIHVPGYGFLQSSPEYHMKRMLAHGVESIYQIARVLDRKSTRLNSSHVSISYAVFCLTKK